MGNLQPTGLRGQFKKKNDQNVSGKGSKAVGAWGQILNHWIVKCRVIRQLFLDQTGERYAAVSVQNLHS